MSLLLLLLLAADSRPSVRIDPAKDANRVTVTATLPESRLKGLTVGAMTQAQGETHLELCLLDADTKKPGPSILGAYTLDAGKITFTPKYTLAAGQRYRAIVHLGNKKTLSAEYTVPVKKAGPRARVEKIYPTTGTLPANHLKFYVYFSRPMRETRTIFDHIRIVDDKGNDVTDPWRRTELWSADNKRLTLLIHPGRIKTGLKLRETLGPVLEENRKYSLVIGSKVLDADGQELQKAFTKTFRTTKAERSLVDPGSWKVAVPKAGTKAALTLTFPRPMDHALLQRLIKVIDADRKPVRVNLAIGREEKSLSLTPEKPWRNASYTIVVDEALEDLAGNTPARVFDLDATAKKPGKVPMSIAFTPGK